MISEVNLGFTEFSKSIQIIDLSYSELLIDQVTVINAKSTTNRFAPIVFTNYKPGFLSFPHGDDIYFNIRGNTNKTKQKS